MAERKYSTEGQTGKEGLLEYTAGLFGDKPENLKRILETLCQNILEAEKSASICRRLLTKEHKTDRATAMAINKDL